MDGFISMLQVEIKRVIDRYMEKYNIEQLGTER